jgi:hypothetical protein
MTRKRKAAVAGVVAAVALGVPGGALAISDEQACENAGGTYTKSGSTSSCAFPVGKSDNTKTTSEKGSFQSNHPEQKTNPGGNQPPGQQGGDTLR